MAARIRILPESISNKIAAGEVVERPASVIKELLENAIDAGGTEISVETANGGRRLIRVTDNGHGMSREDALLSIERHATSKIISESDLDAIITLGFRGEALASIASVSRFTILTREPRAEEGTEITLEGGKLHDVKACGIPTGTVISVENLFFNTPARLKFMRSPVTESGHIGDTISRIAISRPEISFIWINDDREQIRVAKGDISRRLSQIMGRETAASLLPVNTEREGIALRGCISASGTARSNASAIYTYINGRFVRDRIVQHAIMQAYRGVIDQNRYPVMALFIDIPPADVDVNVHPTKHEVRFRHQSMVHDIISSCIEEILRSSSRPLARGGEEPAGISESFLGVAAYRTSAASALKRTLDVADIKPPFPLPFYRYPSTSGTVAEASEPSENFGSATVPGAYFSEIRIIGQFHGEYIVCESETELVIIDQHAASERIAYERLKKEWQNGGIESQRLLFAETVELTFAEITATRSFKRELALAGFEIEPFSGNTAAISAAPAIIAGREAVQLLRDIISDFARLGISAAFQATLDSIVARIACHSVIRGVRKMETAEIMELLRKMDETDFALTCPHGRPVYRTVPLFQIEKMFGRR